MTSLPKLYFHEDNNTSTTGVLALRNPSIPTHGVSKNYIADQKDATGSMQKSTGM